MRFTIHTGQKITPFELHGPHGNGRRSPCRKVTEKRSSVSNYPFQFFENNHNKKSLEGNFQKHLQTSVRGTEHTVTTDIGKIIHRKFISDPITFQKETKAAPKIGDTITPKNRHCLRGVDGKYI